MRLRNTYSLHTAQWGFALRMFRGRCIAWNDHCIPSDWATCPFHWHWCMELGSETELGRTHTPEPVSRHSHEGSKNQRIFSHYTLFEIFIFLSKNSTLISWEKLSNCFGWKTRGNAVVWNILAVDNIDFTRKIVKKKFGRKTGENVGDLHFLVVDNFDFPRKL